MVAVKMRANWILTIFIIFVVDFSLAKVDSMAEEDLRESLMVNYNKDVLPPRNTTGPVKIYACFSLVSIRDIDERLRNMELTGRLPLLWNDPRLRWDPKKHNGTLSLRMGVNHLWKPNITLNDRADVPIIESPTDHALLCHVGNILWIPRSHLTASCVHDATDFPLVTLDCSLKFGSRVYDGAHLDLELYHNPSDVDLSDMEENNEWIVVSTSAKKTINKYESWGESYSDVTFHLTLERSRSIRKAAILFPFVLALILAVAAFLISPFSILRLSIHAFVVIMTLLTLLHIQQLLPTFALNPPTIVFKCESMIAIVSLAMVWNIALMSIYRYCCTREPPRWVQGLSRCWLGKEMRIPKPDNTNVLFAVDQSVEMNIWMGFFLFLNYFVDVTFCALLVAVLYA